MKRIHIISIGDPHMYHLAIALKKKGHEVSCSGVDIIESIKSLLQEEDLLPQEGWFPDQLKKGIDYVVPSMLLGHDNPELLRARELGLLVLSFPEFVFRQTKDKIRVVVGGSKGQSRLLSMIIFALKKQNLLCDYVALGDIPGQKKPIALSYDARIVLLEADECATSEVESRPKHFFYRPHILLNPNLIWEKSVDFPTFESYFELFKELILIIERDGKYIFNEDEKGLKVLSEMVREDVTAIPYQSHPIELNNGQTELVTRFGNYPLQLSDDSFLSDLNAARLTCRQLGVKDKDFYAAVSEYSFLFNHPEYVDSKPEEKREHC